jgi:hypothetical protein
MELFTNVFLIKSTTNDDNITYAPAKGAYSMGFFAVKIVGVSGTKYKVLLPFDKTIGRNGMIEVENSDLFSKIYAVSIKASIDFTKQTTPPQ